MSDDFFDELSDLTPDGDRGIDLNAAGGDSSGLIKLASLVEDLNRDMRIDIILERAIAASIELTGAERGFLVLISNSGEWEFSVAKNMERDIDDAESAASRTIIRKVLEGRRPLLVNDVVGASDLTKQQSIAKMQVRSVMGAPLISKGKLLGAAYVDTSRLAGVFDHTSLVLFETFVHLAAAALESARLIKAESESKVRYKELQEYLSSILKSQPHGVVILDSDYQIEYANPQAMTLLGRQFRIGMQMFETGFCDRATGEQIKYSLKSFINDGIDCRDVMERGGRSIAYSFFRVEKAHDGHQRTGMILEDITVRKRLEKQLIESEKRSTVNQLAAGIAHEINNSLQPVKGRVELLAMRLERQGISLVEGIDTDLTTIATLTERIEKIAKNLRHLTKPAAPDFKPIDVKALLLSTVDMMVTTTGSLKKFSRDDADAAYRLALDIDDNLPKISGDAHGLESAIINMIINATHAIHQQKSGSLTLRARHWADRVVVIVEDTGGGIAPDVLPHIFEPYYTTKGEEGTGLGMSILQNIADIHGADLIVDSMEREGTTVTLSFPIIENDS